MHYAYCIVILFYFNLIVSMEQDNHQLQPHSKTIPNSVTVRNYTNKTVQLFVIPERKRFEWFPKKAMIPGKEMYQMNLHLGIFEPNRMINLTDTSELRNLKKQQILRPQETAKFSFNKFQRNPRAIEDDEEWIMYVEDSNRKGIICNALLAESAKKSFIVTVLSKKNSQSRQSVEFPKNNSSVNFTLDIIDGPKKKLEESDFFATVVD